MISLQPREATRSVGRVGENPGNEVDSSVHLLLAISYVVTRGTVLFNMNRVETCMRNKSVHKSERKSWPCMSRTEN